MLTAIDHASCDLPLPDAWQAFPGRQQNGTDHACALLCLAAAALHFGLVSHAMPARALLQGVTPPSARRAIARRCKGAAALPPRDLEALAGAGGMQCVAPAQQHIHQFAAARSDRLWIARVRQRLRDPNGIARRPVQRGILRSQHVLVLDYLAASDALVIFDPHPWNRSVYCVALPMFEAGWCGAKQARAPWSAMLSPLPRSSHRAPFI